MIFRGRLDHQDKKEDMECLVDQLVLFIFICLFIVLHLINAYFYSLPEISFRVGLEQLEGKGTREMLVGSL